MNRFPPLCTDLECTPVYVLDKCMSSSSSDKDNSKVRTKSSGTWTYKVGARFGAGGGVILHLLTNAVDDDVVNGNCRGLVSTMSNQPLNLGIA